MSWSQKGYVRYRLPNGSQVYEHRQLFEEYLGRELRPKETVHHKNLNRSNNDLSNLELWSKAQPTGARVVDLLDYAVDIINQYLPEAPLLCQGHTRKRVDQKLVDYLGGDKDLTPAELPGQGQLW